MSKRDVVVVNGVKARVAGMAGYPISRFADSMRGVVISLEMRSAEDLALDASVNPDPVMREHALYQLVDQIGPAAIPDVERALFNDPDPEVRINVMWLLESLDSERCAEIARALREDP